MNDFAAWISPEGKMHKINVGDHEAFAQQMGGTKEDLLDKGWTRISSNAIQSKEDMFDSELIRLFKMIERATGQERAMAELAGKTVIIKKNPMGRPVVVRSREKMVAEGQLRRMVYEALREEMGLEPSSQDETFAVRSNLRHIANYATHLYDEADSIGDVPEWVQEKIAIAAEYLSGIKHYYEEALHQTGYQHDSEKDEPANRVLREDIAQNISFEIDRIIEQWSNYKLRQKFSSYVIDQAKTTLKKQIMIAFAQINKMVNRGHFSDVSQQKTIKEESLIK